MRILSAALAASALIALAPAQTMAAPVDYVRVCDAEGVGYAYIPGTEECVDMRDLENDEGVALSIALPHATVDEGKSFGLSVGVGTYGGDNAVGIGGAFKAGDGLTFNGAVGIGAQGGKLGGNLSTNFSW